ncbi:HEXXH motif-containing putative peptide modification protein [Streptomyces sp. NPDC047017]|uniref:aKG-HExxH-type peptide beta-hydroxylase n=1 Tax=Streptomyces sp. NPDC047017 TaxID=3155024 RepID=UPI0033DCAE3D
MRFLNNGHLAETVARFAHALNKEYPTGVDELAPAYRKAITTLRPYASAETGVRVSYEDGPWADHCRENGIFEHIFAGATATGDPTREAWDLKVHGAFEHVRDLEPDLHRMVELLVTDVVVLNSGVDGGGSVNTVPGLVVMSPAEGWEVEDFAECLVHEGLHTGLFLMDMVYGMFNLTSAAMEADEYRALSAVKIGQMRPLDKAFHAAAVAVPLMYMQHRRGVSTLVDLYTKSLRDACESLLEQREHFTGYGRMLLDEMVRWADTAPDPLDFQEVARSISDPAYAGVEPEVAA